MVVTSTPRTAIQVTKGFDLSQKELKFNSTPRSQSPASGRATPICTQLSSEITEDAKIGGKSRDNKLDATQLYKKERGGSKEHLYMVVIGHVDAGKSTLMGRLLCELGQVNIRGLRF